MCRDPIRPRCWYLCETQTIQHFDESSDTVRLIAGTQSSARESWDGIGAAARFNKIGSVIASGNGKWLWCADHWNLLRRVSTTNGVVSTEAQIGLIQSLVWDLRSSTGAGSSGGGDDQTTTGNRYSAFYFVGWQTVKNGRQIGRYDIDLGEPTLFDTLPGAHLPTHLVSTSAGQLLFYCANAQSIYCFDPASSAVELIPGTFRATSNASIDSVAQLIIIESTRTLVVSSSLSIMTYTLPPNCFPLPRCCERDN